MAGAPDVTVAPKSGQAQVNLSSKNAEFSLRIGSLKKARKAMLRGFLKVVLAPMVVFLALAALLGEPASPEAIALAGTLGSMLAIAAAFGIPVMVASWAVGLYPKGSKGRLASDLAYASLLTTMLVLLLFGSGLQGALETCGAEHRIGWTLTIVCAVALFYFGRPLFELLDERKLWLRSMGAKVNIPPLNLNSRFLDFDIWIGKLARGSASAMKAYVDYLVVPTVILAAVYFLLQLLGVMDSNALLTSIDIMFDLVLFFGIMGIALRFARGFYPAGSLGRATFGLLCIPVLLLFVSIIAFGTGIGEALDDNGLQLDVGALIPPLAIYILYIVVIEASELVDCRRSWHKSIGKKVKPYQTEGKYSVFADFRPRYARFMAGSGKGRKNLNKYVREIFYCVIGTALTISAVRFLAGTMTDDVNGLLPDLNGVTDILGALATILLIFSIPNTAFIFLQWSYRKGSFSRLLTGEIACVISIIYVFFFWGALANSANEMYNPSFDPSYLNLPDDWLSQAIGGISSTVLGLMNMVGQALTIVMYLFMALYWSGSIYSAINGFRVYFRSRKRYLEWRESFLRREAFEQKAAATAVVSAVQPQKAVEPAPAVMQVDQQPPPPPPSE